MVFSIWSRPVSRIPTWRDGLAGAELRSAAAVAVSLGCGLRTQELQYAVRADLGADWVLKVEHVKGRGTYGEPRSVIVPPLFRPLLVRYFERSCGLALISSASGATLSSNSLRKILSVASAAAGVFLDFRVLRRTFGQCYIDAGLDVETVSVLMGHSTTRTTEYYYCRRSKSAALQRQSGILDSLAGEKVSAGGGVRTLDLRISLEGSNRPNPMSPTLHQAKPPRHL